MHSFLFGALLAGAVSASPALRERQSAVPVGTIITSCTVAGTFALTFDDGPYEFTNELLDILAANGVHATFFVNGQNWANIYDYSGVIQRMVADGHQVGSHTWDHADLTTLSTAGIISEMQQLETALQSIIGRVPTYMRPPYFSTNGAVLSTLGGLGYHVIQAGIDTLDYENQGNIQVAINNFASGLGAGGTISLEHDVYQFTVEDLVPAAIADVKAKGLTLVPVGQCLGDPAANWYKGSGSGTTPPSGNPSPDETCGGSNGYTCINSQCCSQWGWCGLTSDYCGAGCQPAFGVCS
ncbi:hypothetical protein BX600DRAFT_461797 [Xylariales sp. PMI_506]|nr:hypothetical protein BX600DRAFT_461797 [Xylariales sp. PMI_506]